MAEPDLSLHAAKDYEREMLDVALKATRSGREVEAVVAAAKDGETILRLFLLSGLD